MRLALLTLLALAAPASPAAAPTTRTVYVTVTDDQGMAVPDLTAADFTVKEGGKEREIVKAERATERQRLALLVEERLVSDGAIRTAMFEFMKRMLGAADISLITVGLRNNTVVDYTGDGDALVRALNSLSLNPQPVSAITEGVLELARSITQQKPARPTIVVLAFSGGQAGGASAKEVLDNLRQSGAIMSSVTLSGFEGTGNTAVGGLSDASNREQVLGDGPKQSGGRRIEIASTKAAPKALQQVAGDLLAQYAISYTLPDGTKPDKRLSVSLKRKGTTLRAPNAIPDR